LSSRKALGVTGRVIALNGASSAGKTTVGAALQGRLDEPWMLIGVDTFLPLLGAEWLWVPMQDIRGRHGRDGISFDQLGDGSVTVSMGAAGRRLMDGLRTSVAALLAEGHDLILDLVLLDAADRASWRAAIGDAGVLWVGIECPLPELEIRERARGDRVRGLARAQVASVHRDMVYDVVIDSSTTTAEQAADLIVDRLRAEPTRARTTRADRPASSSQR
jgi:chloramphenicol 3-O phosphotransferase